MANALEVGMKNLKRNAGFQLKQKLVYITLQLTPSNSTSSIASATHNSTFICGIHALIEAVYLEPIKKFINLLKEV